MSLRTLLHWTAGHLEADTEPAPEIPLCGAAPGSATWGDFGGPFPEFTEHRSVPCADPATVFALGSCPCGHGGSMRWCSTHAAVSPDAQNCGPCAEEYGHRCLVIFTLNPL